jgi:hypothetical protein
MTDPGAVVRLRTGTEVPVVATRLIIRSLRRLADGGMPEFVALIEARRIAANPAHQPFGRTGETLRGMYLLDESGKMHDVTRDVILAAVEGDEDDPRVVWPFEAGAKPAEGP